MFRNSFRKSDFPPCFFGKNEKTCPSHLRELTNLYSSHSQILNGTGTGIFAHNNCPNCRQIYCTIVPLSIWDWSVSFSLFEPIGTSYVETTCGMIFCCWMDAIFFSLPEWLHLNVVDIFDVMIICLYIYICIPQHCTNTTLYPCTPSAHETMKILNPHGYMGYNL